MPVTVTREAPDSAAATVLITELEEYLARYYPPENRFGFSSARLAAEKVPFFVLHYDEVPAGCGGIKLFGTEYGELKRMYVRPQYRGKKLGHLLLDHMAGFALENDVKLLKLETGIYQEAAIKLYENYGFVRTSPFGDYTATPLNIFFEKKLVE